MNAEFAADPFRFAYRPLLATAAIMTAFSFRLSGKLVDCRLFADGLPHFAVPLASLSVGVTTGAIKFVFSTGLAEVLLPFNLNRRDNPRDAVRTCFLPPR